MPNVHHVKLYQVLKIQKHNIRCHSLSSSKAGARLQTNVYQVTGTNNGLGSKHKNMCNVENFSLGLPAATRYQAGLYLNGLATHLYILVMCYHVIIPISVFL